MIKQKVVKEIDCKETGNKIFSAEGQLVCRMSDYRFFVIIDPQFRTITQEILNKEHYEPTDPLGCAHINVNEAMDKESAKNIFDQYKKQYGISEKPTHLVTNDNNKGEFVYLNYKKPTVSFTIGGIYLGNPFTNSRLEEVYCIRIDSAHLDSMANDDGLKCGFSDKNYQTHSKFAEKKRILKSEYKIAGKYNTLNEVLSNTGLSSRLIDIIQSKAVTLNNPYTTFSSNSTATPSKEDKAETTLKLGNT